MTPLGETSSPDGVPVIDVADARTGRDLTTAAAAVDRACREVGFLAIVGHGVSDALFDEAFAVSRAFFELPAAEKARSRPIDEVAPRGYAALASKGLAGTLGASAPKDLREQFMLGTLDPPPPRLAALEEARGCYAPNVWPERPERYRPVFTELYRALDALSRDLMRVFAVALGLPSEHFQQMIDAHFSVLGSNYYPPLTEPPLPGQLRTGAHTDFGSLTILCPTAGPGGLEVLRADGAWMPVQPEPGQLIVNIGDMMARWTNDLWRSTLHRVVNPPDRLAAMSLRQSIAFFCHPNYDAEIVCLPTCVGPDRPPRHPPILAGRHMREKMLRR